MDGLELVVLETKRFDPQEESNSFAVASSFAPQGEKRFPKKQKFIMLYICKIEDNDLNVRNPADCSKKNRI